MTEYQNDAERAAFAAGMQAAAEQMQTSKPLTRREVKAMSQDEINANWPAVQAALAAGLPEGDDDE